jgi:hypothetical protein
VHLGCLSSSSSLRIQTISRLDCPSIGPNERFSRFSLSVTKGLIRYSPGPSSLVHFARVDILRFTPPFRAHPGPIAGPFGVARPVANLLKVATHAHNPCARSGAQRYRTPIYTSVSAHNMHFKSASNSRLKNSAAILPEKEVLPHTSRD